MRSVKKLLKKAMVFTLTAAMLVGTPLAASAAPLNSVYSIGDHWGNKKDEGDDRSHTGTVTNTATTTESGVLKDNETKILGIALDRTHLDMEKGVQEELTATILFDADDAELVNKYGDKDTEKMKKVLANMIRWEVQNSDGTVDADTNKTLSIRVANPKEGDASTVILNPRKGTEAGKDMIVKAYLEGSWYIGVDEDGKATVKELTTNKTDGYSKQATVSIKEYTKSLSWEDGNDPIDTYVKHTVDLGAKLVRDPETANDNIIWTSTDPKVATVNAKGVVTIKNVAGKTCKIIAMGEKETARAERTINVTAGTPVSKIEIYKVSDPNKAKITKAIEWDLKDYKNDEYQASEELAVQTFATIKGVVVNKNNNKEAATSLDDAKTKTNGDLVTGNLTLPDGAEYYLVKSDDKKALSEVQTVIITDDITWSSNKAAIADVNPTTGTETTVTTKGAIGNAVITAKASSGKNAKVTFKIKGSLDTLEISGISDGETLYSGQTKDLVAVKNPVGSKDGVKWSIEQVTKKGTTDKKINHPNVTINGKGKLTIKDKLDLDPNYMTATISLASAKKVDGKPVVGPVTVTINLEQSSINGITVRDETTDAEVASLIYKNETNNDKQHEKKNVSVPIKVPVSHTFAATVDTGYSNGGADEETLASTLTWTTNNKKAVDIIDLGGGKKKIVAKADGKATITVTGLRATSKVQNGNTVLKGVSKMKVSFKVEVTQPVETMTMNKASVTLAQQNQTKQGVTTPKSQNVTLKVTLGPKGVKTGAEKLTWSILKTVGEQDDTIVPVIGRDKKPTDKLNATFKLVKPEAGDVYVVTAKSTTGVVATSTIKIVTKTVGVEMSGQSDLGDDGKPVIFKEGRANNKKAIKIGDSFQIYSFVNVGTNAQKPDWKPAGSDDKIEGVTYSVNKKGIVSVDSEGNVVGLGKGTVKITAKTPMGKSKAITVVVDLPTN